MTKKLIEADNPVTPRIRADGFGFCFPGPPIDIDSLPLSPEELKRLPRLKQKVTYISHQDSTELMVEATQAALLNYGGDASSIRMVISAPSLVTSYGLEIPSVAICAAVGFTDTECLNIAQGCVGVLRAIDLAKQLIRSEPNKGDILIVTSCRASSFTQNMNHGAFFWGDAAAAIIVTADVVSGLEIASYAETSSDKDWGAMRIKTGDAGPVGSEINVGELIFTHFEDAESQMEYIRSEQRRFASVIEKLMNSCDLHQDEIDAIFIPSTGENRIPLLFSDHYVLSERIKTDFQYAHFGGVDSIFSIYQNMKQSPSESGAWMIAASPAFAAQWGGLLLRVID